MKTAIVHDYLNQAGGAERVVAVLHEMFPRAPIYTTILDRSSLWPGLRDADIRTSWMQHLPGLRRHFKKYLPLYPAAIESLDLADYDLVISSSSAFAKGARVRPGARHICYCYTPMRFAWDYQRYVEHEGFGVAVRFALPPVIRALREWDVRTASRPHIFVAISSVVAERIQKSYGRPSEVVFPPVEIGRCTMGSEPGDFYLVVSRLNAYKRIDLAINAFTTAGRSLVVIGDGPCRATLERMAGPTIRFLGRVPDEELTEYYARCRGLIFPGEEDFGIAPLEANASGRPVVAYRAGGALDTVVDGCTGVHFREQTVPSLLGAIARCDALLWVPDLLRRHAERFSSEAFKNRFESIVERELAGIRPAMTPASQDSTDPPRAAAQGR